jgi:rfaE bifunctional protein kinase chain/domain/rfaE bifunctional protein nucleotidyltransferase chain/domain
MFQHKIKTLEELLTAVGPRPRKKTVIMCHGVFDIVHPGHLRHLMYAKEKADILVASLTADAYITKADNRPYVPQELRAQNLAALEIVDYVIIDPNRTPIDHIRRLQPDYFAKGYEYFAEGIPPRTQEEIDTLETYGGEIVFTPGDVVYSSSKLLELQAPRIAVDKLLSLMDSEAMDFARLRKALRGLSGVRVHVVGDTIVDGYSECTLLGPAAKLPAFSVKLERTERFSGGAAIVARHLKGAGAEVSLSTVLGDDPLKDFVLQELEEAKISCSPIIDRTRPTTYKERFTTDGHKLLQVDRVDNRPISDKTLHLIGEELHGRRADVVILSDFRHGIFNRESIPHIVAEIPAGRLKVADSQVSNRWGNILDFTDFDLITPNEREARFALGDQDTTVRPLALKLYRQARCRYLILKLGERGVLTYQRPGHDVRDFFAVDSLVDRLVDPIGAGDALLAYASLSLVATGSIVVGSILGSLAAAVSCEHQGNVPITPAEVEQKIDSLERLARYR